jgi:hypothetical protein
MNIELLTQIAERIMGWRIRHVKGRVLADVYESGIGCVMTWRLTDAGAVSRFNPWDSDEHAIMVAKALAKRFRRFEIHLVDGVFVCQIEAGTSAVDEHYLHSAEGETLGEAVCAVARAVLESE